MVHVEVGWDEGFRKKNTDIGDDESVLRKLIASA